MVVAIVSTEYTSGVEQLCSIQCSYHVALVI